MINLANRERSILNNILQDYYGSFEEYTKLVSATDISRLLRNINQLIILKPWDINMTTKDLGHLSSYDLIFLDTLYRELIRFSNVDILGGDNLEHITWINSLEHGQQLYLKVNNSISSKCFLCLVCKYLPEDKRKTIVKEWLSQIQWDNKFIPTNNLLLNYSGKHTLRIYYLNSAYEYHINSLKVINDPNTQVITKTFEDQLNLYILNTGYYIFKEIFSNDEEVNLKLIDLNSISNKLNYKLIDNITYYFGTKPDVQILLNTSNFYEESYNYLVNNNNFVATGSLAQI